MIHHKYSVSFSDESVSDLTKIKIYLHRNGQALLSTFQLSNEGVSILSQCCSAKVIRAKSTQESETPASVNCSKCGSRIGDRSEPSCLAIDLSTEMFFYWLSKELEPLEAQLISIALFHCIIEHGIVSYCRRWTGKLSSIINTAVNETGYAHIDEKTIGKISLFIDREKSKEQLNWADIPLL